MSATEYFKILLPHPSLRDYVKQFLFVRLDIPASCRAIKPCWPTPFGRLDFNLGDLTHLNYVASGVIRPEPRVGLFGQSTETSNRWHGPNLMRFQVLFQPGALFRLTGIPHFELADAPFDADDVFSAEVRRLYERSATARDFAEIVAFAELFLRDRIERSGRRLLPIDRVASLMMRNSCRGSLDDMAGMACLSVRQFYNNFIGRMGVSPRTFRRIARLNHAITYKLAYPSSNWPEIASRLGYYDYQHMVKDFRQFTLHTPGQIVDSELILKRRLLSGPGGGDVVRWWKELLPPDDVGSTGAHA